jgi:dihydroorotase
MSARVLRGGRVVDPRQGHDAIADVIVVDGRVSEIKSPGGAPPAGAEVVDVDGCWVLPGAIDTCAYVREPGREDDEPLSVTLASAARGGFTSVLAMPSTLPPVDGGDDVVQRLAAAAQVGGADLLVAGALSAGLEGKELAEIGEMTAAGAVAFTDAPKAVASAGLLRRAMEYTHGFDRPVIASGPCPSLSRGGLVAEGSIATRLGLAAIPEAAETTFVARSVELARLTGARVHVGPISAARSLLIVQRARAEGVGVSASTLPFHLLLDERVHVERPYDTALHLQPPLRTPTDREALLEAVRAGELMLASGHAPVGLVGKDAEMALSEPGAVSLPTCLPLLAATEAGGLLDAVALARASADLPAQLLALDDRGHLSPGARADICVLDPSGGEKVDELLGDPSASTPFRGRTTAARVRLTLVGGEVAWQA